MSEFGPALGVANAVLYEGYLLFPYTASSGKNRVRWQFGVVVPAAYAQTGTGEPSQQQTEVLLEPGPDAKVDVLLRFLQVESRRVETFAGGEFTPVASLIVAGTTYLTFDEAVEREVLARLPAARAATQIVPVAFEAGSDVEVLRDADGATAGRVVRERWPLAGTLTIAIEAIEGPYSLAKLRVRVENDSSVVAGETRDSALRTAFVSTHVLLRIDEGRFLSTLDPPEFAGNANAALESRHVFPVLVGDERGDAHGAALVLASPIILYDFPALAPQTDSDAFDGTEIEELLALSVLSLSDAERAEARATDPRARAIVDRAEAFGAQQVDRLHFGSLLYRSNVPPPLTGDPFAAIDVPALDCVFVGGVKVSKGSAVRLHPKRRADVWDEFLDGKIATVRAIHQDVEDTFYVAVTIDEDPASDLHEWYGRSFFFYPDEVEPVVASEARQ